MEHPAATPGPAAGVHPPPTRARRLATAVVGPTFASLAVRNYRIWAAGALVSNTGTWMQRVAQDWLVLTVLTDDSAVALGIVTALQFGPFLLFGPLAGLAADRLPQRALLIATQTLSAVWSLLLGALVVTGSAELWSVYALAALQGVTSTFDAPVRQTYVASMVPADRLANAVSLNSASFNAARLVGPGAAGLLIAAVGTGPVFFVNAATFAATGLSLAALRTRELHPLPRAARGRGGSREALRYVRSRPDLLLVLLVVGMVGAFGLNFQMTTAFMARTEFGRGPAEYGLLGSVLAVGSLTGALLAARRSDPSLRLVVRAAAAFGVFALVASAMPTYAWFALSLVPVGVAALTVMTAANATVQTTTAPELRGRVMALYMTVFLGTTPVGAPLVGWIAEAGGPRWSIAVGGLAALLAALLAAALGRRAPAPDPGRASALAQEPAQTQEQEPVQGPPREPAQAPGPATGAAETLGRADHRPGHGARRGAGAPARRRAGARGGLGAPARPPAARARAGGAAPGGPAGGSAPAGQRPQRPRGEGDQPRRG